jgi:hypothetical protein
MYVSGTQTVRDASVAADAAGRAELEALQADMSRHLATLQLRLSTTIELTGAER